MKYRYQRVKMAVMILCLLAAGACYSCSRGQDGWESEDLAVLDSSGGDGTVLDETALEGLEGTEETERPDTGGSAQNAEAAAAAETSEAVSCYVHICGEVAAPGVYEMEEGSRVFQVVERAGGFTEQAASQYLNMAQTVSDGMKIVVPALEALGEEEQYGSSLGVSVTEGTGLSGSGTAGATAKVNLNTASKEELMTLKGIGEAKADDIIAYRESHGGFQKIEDIMKISGIKNAAFEKIKDDITV